MTKRAVAILVVWLAVAIALGAWANHKWPSDPYGNPVSSEVK